MTKDTLKIVFRFLLLIPFQVLIANHIRLFGFINPQICLLYLLWFPLKKDNTSFLISSFLFGLSIDFFSNSGGINAAACLLIAYLKIPLMKFVFKDKDLDLKTFRYYKYGTLPKIVLICLMALIHQTVIYSLEYFNLCYTTSILYKSLLSGLFTTFVVVILLSIFTPTQKQ